MKKIIFVLFLAVMLAAASMCMADTETEYKWYEVTEGNSPFLYSDSLLMVDENKLDPDIAKISAALSSAAYNKNTSKRILESMEYEVLFQEKYDESFAITDCHHVAYNIARKYAGDYIIYCVSVRGTYESMEWISNFTI